MDIIRRLFLLGSAAVAATVGALQGASAYASKFAAPVQPFRGPYIALHSAEGVIPRTVKSLDGVMDVRPATFLSGERGAVASNNQDITFDAATRDVGYVTGAGIYDEGGNCVFHANFEEPRYLFKGDTFMFPAGAVTVSID